jgi:hypothetical protein
MQFSWLWCSHEDQLGSQKLSTPYSTGGQIRRTGLITQTVSVLPKILELRAAFDFQQPQLRPHWRANAFFDNQIDQITVFVVSYSQQRQLPDPRTALARLKRILRLGRLHLRGPRGAQFEFTLAATAQNLRRLAKLIARPPPKVAQCPA